MAKFYAVLVGRKTGVFNTWSECEKQTKGFKGAVFKSYPTYDLAQKAIEEYNQHNNQTVGDESTSTSEPDNYIENSLSVDAACSGNPGYEMEYQCVDTKTGNVMFNSEVFPVGTNNIGEFLALVDALQFLDEVGEKDTPVYSDSVTAIAWVRNKRVNTNLPRNKETEKLWDEIEYAIERLNTFTYPNPILKWDTKAWGESKADFGRK